MRIAVQLENTVGGQEIAEGRIEVSEHHHKINIHVTNSGAGTQKGGVLELSHDTAKRLAYALLFATAPGAGGSASLDVKEVPDWQPATADMMDDRHLEKLLRD